MGIPWDWARANIKDLDERIALLDKPRRPAVIIPGEPIVIGHWSARGWWKVAIAHWMPINKNKKTKLKEWIRGRKRDNEVLANCLGRLGPDCPTANGRRRRVTLEVVRKTAKAMPDGQNLEESLYDALKVNGFIVDDSARWLERTPTIVTVNRELEYPVVSTVTVEDV